MNVTIYSKTSEFFPCRKKRILFFKKNSLSYGTFTKFFQVSVSYYLETNKLYFNLFIPQFMEIKKKK